MSQFGVAPDRVTINAQIDCAIKQGRPDEAIQTFQRALDGVSKPALQKTLSNVQSVNLLVRSLEKQK